MIIEKRTYNIRPGAAAQFLEMVEKKELPMLGARADDIIGYYSAEVGQLNQIIGMWRHDSFEARAAGRARFAAHPDYPDLAAQLLPLMISQDSQFLTPAPFFARRMGW